MCTRSSRYGLVVAVLAATLSACGGGDDTAVTTTTAATTTTAPGTTTTVVPATSNASPTTTAATPTTTTSATTTTAADAAVLIEVDVAGGEVTGPSRPMVPLGSEVRLVVTSDQRDEVHVHGYDFFLEVGPDAVAELSFAAEIPGVFEVELEDSGILLLELEVS